MAEDEYRYLDGKISIEHDEIIADHLKLIRKTYKENYLILSSKFIALYEELFISMGTGDPNSGPDEQHHRFADAIRKSRPKLLEQGKGEMPDQQGWLSRGRRSVAAAAHAINGFAQKRRRKR